MKSTTLFLITSGLLLINNPLLSQTDEEKYKSSSEKAYYDSLSKTYDSKKFVPVGIEFAKAISHTYIKVEKITHPSRYNPHQIFPEFWDSTMQANKNDSNDPRKFLKLMQEIQNVKVGPIPRMSIIKEERFNNKWAILYTDSKYDDFIYGGWGYWIALSNDAGKTWNKYYTGISENYYYFFKRTSNIPLWKDSSTLQIESVIVRQITQVSHPIPAEFELIEDGLAVQINIYDIILDSDNDGLTDICEEKMLLNPSYPDTDGDGINDFVDTNPRFKSKKSSRSFIYETLIDGFNPNKQGVMEIDTIKSSPLKKSRKNQNSFDLETVNILVTDDPLLQQLNPKKQTLIILTSEEYVKYIEKYPSHFIESNLSPMFKCDNFDDTFLIHTRELTGGSTYLVQKTKNGWKISVLSSWIS